MSEVLKSPTLNRKNIVFFANVFRCNISMQLYNRERVNKSFAFSVSRLRDFVLRFIWYSERAGKLNMVNQNSPVLDAYRISQASARDSDRTRPGHWPAMATPGQAS